MVSIKLDYSLLIQIINFLVLMITLNIILYRPIRNMIKERKQKFFGFESEISSLTGQADERAGEIESRLAEAKREGFLKKDEITGVGLEEEKAMLAEANSRAEAERQKMQDQITLEIAAARESLKADLEVFSRELAQKVLGRSLV